MADVHELILRLPEGYDTRIGASGGNLSGGAASAHRFGQKRCMAIPLL